MIKKIPVYLLLFLTCPYLHGQKNLSISTDTIPFVLTDHNNIAVEAILNKKDTLLLMFHTDAGVITLTEEATAKLSSLDLSKSDSTESWGGKNSSRYGNNNSLQIQNLDWDNLTIWENQHSGPTTDGKFGPHLFSDKTIEINYDKKHNGHPFFSTRYG